MRITKFIGWHSVTPLRRDEIEMRLDRIRSFSRLPGHEMVIRTQDHGHTGLILWIPEREICHRLTCRANELVACTYPPYGISRLVDMSRQDSLGSALCELVGKLEVKPSLIQEISPPVAIVNISGDWQLRLINDIRGLGEIYEFRGRDGVSVWSNVLGYLPLFSGVATEDDSCSSSLRAIFSYYPRHHTPIKGCRRLEGGTQVLASNSPEPPETNTQPLLLSSLSNQIGQAYSAKEARIAFLETLASYLDDDCARSAS
jgi:hypothetical protein